MLGSKQTKRDIRERREKMKWKLWFNLVTVHTERDKKKFASLADIAFCLFGP